MSAVTARKAWLSFISNFSPLAASVVCAMFQASTRYNVISSYSFDESNFSDTRAARDIETARTETHNYTIPAFYLHYFPAIFMDTTLACYVQ